MEVEKLLKYMVDREASDAFITVGVPPSLKINGELKAVSESALSEAQARAAVISVMTAAQRAEFDTHHECNFALQLDGIGRFRASAFYQRNQCGMVLRRIQEQIPTFSELDLPPVMLDLAMAKRGLVIFVGATGTGKSTSLAAMIGHRNLHGSGHIVTIEDPIEFVHRHRGCIVTQREVGIDTDSFDVALKNTLRQAPDVIMIGEVRSRETMEKAITFAETGHLCLCTLHANNANQALDRIQHFFPTDRQQQVWMDLSLNLRGIVAQQLIPKRDGSGRAAIIEVMLNSPLMSERIRKGEVHLMKELMAKSKEAGMQTFDQALFVAVKAGKISAEDALLYADSANELRLMMKLDGSDPQLSSDAPNLTFDDSGLGTRKNLFT
ncbi:PilT/PilU family type 4a pilus ATPase [Halieaceae bacterium IMCC14734]|uniref:PilT/PilU family type 4a pilus ATPase n=1 Tax=Candidatus Litorirhabdus singularis TaxID=2518993 RepID=A0ABT3TDZ7_9GAMM|nr:PilT/PilU family type 4a pilus ATPase [Candidatus Litorirhabdus singularis]MCX2980045.1 PilT/PilU family type 4a pilus ATPase [Candidatus Litorirhabdus singularis]